MAGGAWRFKLTMIRLLIADDHSLMREGVKQLISLSDDVIVVGEAESGEQVMKLVRGGGFDLVLLDMSMPSVSGVDLIAWIHVHNPSLPILVLSMHNEPKVVTRALQAGASGYLTKDSDPKNLMVAIRKVAAGGQFVDPRLVERIAFKGSADHRVPSHLKLTERELQILRLLVRGISSNQIAEELLISNKTVSTHKVRLMKKMDLHNNADLMRYAVVHGLVE